MRDNQQGISNREKATAEQDERQHFPPRTPDAPPREQDAADSFTAGGAAGSLPRS